MQPWDVGGREGIFYKVPAPVGPWPMEAHEETAGGGVHEESGCPERVRERMCVVGVERKLPGLEGGDRT